ncbi:MAG TPA: SulP family inorganic anion transporter [Pirellulaceae bacterium]|nr:SulP family inorganic anion transporter [Pirellulaceae bacterium]
MTDEELQGGRMSTDGAVPAGGWRQDALASLVVFLVAMPLCMGIALASGAPVAAGLVTGIIGGLIVGCLAGSPLQVSGPAAGLTVICGEVIREHGMQALGVVVLFAGALQFAAGLFKLGQWFRAVSPAVIHGMLSGIGVLILSSQIHVMVDDRPQGSGLANLISIPEAVVKGLPLPVLEPAERQAERTQLLKQFGQLHERQAEVQSHVGRIITRHGSERRHEWERDHLADFLPPQQALVKDLRAAQQAAEQSKSGLGGDRAEVLAAAVTRAVQSAEAALADLEQQRLETVPASQAQATQALVAVGASLKSHDWAAKVGLLSILIIMMWQALTPNWMRLIPGPLLAVLACTGVAWWLALPVLYVEVPDNLIDGLTFPSLSVLQDVAPRPLAIAALMMAVVASAETLLCAAAVDRIHTGPRTQYDRELSAQGVGNMLCGLVGALPMTGVIVRSAANVQAGASSRLSAILHGVWLLVFVAAMGFVLRMIPTACLAGILVYTGFKLIDFKGFQRLWKYSRTEAAIFAVTLVVIVVEDLLLGVITGVVLSAVKLLISFSHLDVQLTTSGDRHKHPQVTLTIAGAATFLRLPVLAARLEEVPQGAHLHVDFEHLDYIDHACLELLMTWAKQHEMQGGRLVIDWGQLHARFREVRRGPPRAGPRKLAHSQ